MKAGDEGPGTGRHGLLGRGEQKEIEEQESPSSGHLSLRTALEISVNNKSALRMQCSEGMGWMGTTGRQWG